MNFSEKSKALDAATRPVVENLGYELVDFRLSTERGRLVLRFLVDRPGGITLDECAKLSREISPHLEVANLLPRSYSLQVSSPGLCRPLKNAKDFERFLGENILVRIRQPIENRKTFRGSNQGLNEQGDLVLVDNETAQSQIIPFAAIREASLDPEIRCSSPRPKPGKTS